MFQFHLPLPGQIEDRCRVQTGKTEPHAKGKIVQTPSGAREGTEEWAWIGSSEHGASEQSR